MAKQIKVREDNYFAVQGWMVTELKLKGNALMLYAIIYGFSQTTTIYTSNLSPEELRSELGDRIASRVLGSSQVVEITSGDRRGL